GLRGQAPGARSSGGPGRNYQCQAAFVSRARFVERRVRARDACADVNLPLPINMNPVSTEIGAQLITLLAAGMLVVQLLLVVQPMLLTSIRLFALQSL